MARRVRRQIVGDLRKSGVTGVKELDKKLKKLSDKQFRGVTRKASNKAMTPMSKATKRNVPVEDGFLKKSIGKKQKTYKRAGVIITFVGARTGFGDEGKDPVKYAHLVEFGVTPHSVRPEDSPVLSDIGSGVDGEVFGASAEHPGFAGFGFQRKSFDQTKGKTMQIYIKEMNANIAKEAKKL